MTAAEMKMPHDIHASAIRSATPQSAESPDVPFLSPDQLPPTHEVMKAIQRFHLAQDWLTAHEAIVWIGDHQGAERLFVAGVDIDDPALQEAAEQLHPAPPLFIRAERNALKPYFAELRLGHAESIALDRADPVHLRELAEETPVIDFVNAMLSEASARRASDVHIEPFEDKLSVRFRIDGVLMLWRTAPRALFDAISSRIKILSGMDIAERRLPQDGRQTLKFSGKEMDVRVSSLPTTWGESIVLRFLGKQSDLPDLARLGFSPDQQATMRKLSGATSGMVLVTGPTGSGKTTTSYRLVTDLNDGLRKIVSVEDPVEIDLPGVLQTQVRSEIGLTFATGLRSILRQDPDIILIGEIRDSETATIAVQAALTGHLVVSTIHTTTALAAVTRLLDLGVEGYFIADVLRGLVGQRLARRLCISCSTPDDGAAEETFACEHIPASRLTDAPAWRRAIGCARCSMTGFSGRIGLFEIATVTADLRKAIRARADDHALEGIAATSGYASALEDGILKARAGLTTLGEVQRALTGWSA